MGKGGGGVDQQPTRTTSVSTSLPEYAEPFYTRLLERTEGESNRPYETFPGQRFATFAPEQEESFGIATDIARQGVPEGVRLGTERATQAADYRPIYDSSQVRSDLAGSGYTPGTFETGRFIDPGVAAQYMNPFVENVIGAQRRRAEQRFGEDVLPGMRARAVQGGAFGGSRAQLSEGLARERLNERLLDQDAQLRATAFQQAQGAFMTDAQRAQRAQQLADASGQEAAKLGITRAELADRAAQAEGRFGLAGEELGLKAAGRLAELGGLEQQYGLRSADVLRQIGEQRQAQEQQIFDIGYSDFLSERDFPRQQLGYLSGIMHGVPVSPSSETSVFQRPPSGGQQLLGYGLGGLGLAKSVFG